MIHAIGANIFGFMIGGSLLFLQVSCVLVYGIFTHPLEETVAEIIAWVVAILLGVVFLLALAYWISSVFLVLPASFLFRVLRISGPVGSMIGVLIAGVVVVSVVKIPGYGNGMSWPSYLFWFSTPLLIGGITGFKLANLLRQREQVGDTCSVSVNSHDGEGN